MQIIKALALATAVYTSAASAKCFQTGEHWDDHNVALTALKHACNKMKGYYRPGEIFTQCRDGADFRSFMFEIQNYNDHGVDLSYNDCVKNIEREIDNCGRGGQETFNGVRYRGDPNKGTCSGAEKKA